MTDVAERLRQALSDRYTLGREIGAGGMATVYLAHDVRHDRKVAVKVLKPELAAVLGAERFLNEIKVTANLQHPNILPLHDSGEAEGFVYYVMPYVEGESLRVKLDREKELSIGETVEITKGVASALDYAHRQDVIHRDIKPENILLHEGQPVVADFGIALAVNAAGGTRLTETGLSLGTPQYMSPEQAMGDRELDGRSDIYSLACIMYEMLAGEAPYTGPTAQAIVTKIITEEPKPVTQSRRTVPTHVDLAIRKALAKLPADRFSNAAQLGDALARPDSLTLGQTPVEGRATASSRMRRIAADPRIALAALVIGIAAGIGLARWLRTGSTVEQAPVRFAMRTQPRFDELTAGTNLAVSPDGRHVVYAAYEGWDLTQHSAADRKLYIRSLGDLEIKAIPGTEGAYTPFFSPDGKWLGFISEGNLMKVALDGGPPVLVAEATSTAARGASWGTNDVIVYSVAGVPGLSRVSADGRVLAPVVPAEVETEQATLRWPAMLPGGKAALVTIWAGSREQAQIGVLSLESGELSPVVLGTSPSYLAPGFLVFAREDGSLLVAPFDAEGLELAGPPVAIEQGLRVYNGGAAQYTVSASGTLIYRPVKAWDRSLRLVDREGRVTKLPDVRSYENGYAPKFDPTGRRVVVAVSEGNDVDIWIYDIGDNTVSRAVREATNRRPSWTPDGTRLTFSSIRRGPIDLYWASADGSGPAEPLVQNDHEHAESTWSPDGRTLVFVEVDPETSFDIALLELDVDSAPRPFLHEEHDERFPAISPDGRWIAYTSNESGANEVYVRPFPGGDGKFLVSQGGGVQPVWSPDGGEVFYRSQHSLIAARVDVKGGFRVLDRTTLFSADNVYSGFDVHPAGDQFVMVSREQEEHLELVIVLNWLSTVRDRAASLSGGS